MSRLKRFAKQTIRPAIRRVGYDIVPFPGNHFNHRRVLLAKALEVDLVVDVGANTGQFGRELRDFGYDGNILSFEPMAQEYAALERHARKDGRWDTTRAALGESRGEVDINVAGNSISSSILPMAERHRRAAEASVRQRVETVPLDRLDNLARTQVEVARAPYLKVDTQGYEWQVLCGASGMLDEFVAIELELSLTELYEGQRLMDTTVDWLTQQGLRLAILESSFPDSRTGETLQMNGVFVRAPWGAL